MDSYPQRFPRNHISYPHHCYPSWEETPPHMKVDPIVSPMTFQNWPSSSSNSFVYPSSIGCHGCCTHSCPSSAYYAFRPPHSHPSPPRPMYYCGPRPYSESYPAYFVPSHYPHELAHYEYDNCKAKEHCSGCPNHGTNYRAGNRVKIEEESPDIKQKESELPSSGWPQNYPYPLAWIPPSYRKDKEIARSFDSDPKLWNGWFPLDLNNIRSPKQGEEKRNERQQIEEKKTQLPFPIVWMPGIEPAEVKKEINSHPKDSEEQQPKLNVIPLKFLENDHHENKASNPQEGSENRVRSKVSENEPMPKNTHVKHSVEGNGVRSELIEKEKKTKTIPVKQVVDREEKSDNNVKKLSTSSVKKSKLPPVCLRVDPLPKNKNGNGTSKSPSLPAPKERVQQDAKPQELLTEKSENTNKRETKITETVERKPATVDKSIEEQTWENGGSSIEIGEKRSPQLNEVKNGEPKLVQVTVSTRDGSTKKYDDKVQAQTGKMEHVNEDGMGVEKNNTIEEGHKKRTELSSTEAAVRIQSAYRAFEVRRWEPLNKLRQIAKVREQVKDIKDKIHHLEASGGFLKDEKQRVVISENIMSLLLQLDTIQSLHSSVREVRKSVAKELIFLQEKLDSIAVQTVGDAAAAGATPTDKYSEPILNNDPVQMESTTQLKELGVTPTEGNVTHVTLHSEIQDAPQALLVEKVEQLKTLPTEVAAVIEGNLTRQSENKEAPQLPLVDKAEELETIPVELGALTEGNVTLHSQNDDASQTLLGDKAQDLETKPAEVIPVPLVEDRMKESKQEESTSLMTEPAAVSGNKENLEMSQGTEDSNPDIEVPVEPCLVNEDPNSMLEEHEQIKLLKDENVDSLTGPLELLVNDEACGSVVNELTEAPAAPPSTIDGDSGLNLERATMLPVVEGSQSEVASSSAVIRLPVPQADSVIEVLHMPSFIEECCPNEFNVSYEQPVSGSDGNTDGGTANILSLGCALPGPAAQTNTVEDVEDGGNKVEAGTSIFEDKETISAAACENDSGPLFDTELSEDIQTELPFVKKQELISGVMGDILPSGEEPGHQISGSYTDKSPSTHIEEMMTEVEAAYPVSLSSSKECAVVDELATPPFEGTVPRDSLNVSNLVKKDQYLVEENDKLREMVEKLISAGKQQLAVISDLSGRVRDLEKQMSKKKKVKVRAQRGKASSCGRGANEEALKRSSDVGV